MRRPVETARDAVETAAMVELADKYAGQTSADGENDSKDNLSSEADDTDISGALELQTDRRNEIVFIDAAVDDIGSLLESINPNVEIYVLDQDSDGVEQIAKIVSEMANVDAIHIISHGGSGFLNLGSSQLNGETITNEHVQALNNIGASLGEDGDILIYGCNFGEGDVGQQVAEQLAKITGADIAASNDLTGSESLDGDWDLEVTAGLRV